MIRLLAGFLGTLTVIGGLIFTAFAVFTLTAFWNASQVLQSASYANEAQAYGIMAIACFAFSLVVGVGNISSQLEKVQDLLADLADEVEDQGDKK
jgi:hypothetical protein